MLFIPSSIRSKAPGSPSLFAFSEPGRCRRQCGVMVEVLCPVAVNLLYQGSIHHSFRLRRRFWHTDCSCSSLRPRKRKSWCFGSRLQQQPSFFPSSSFGQPLKKFAGLNKGGINPGDRCVFFFTLFFSHCGAVADHDVVVGEGGPPLV